MYITIREVKHFKRLGAGALGSNRKHREEVNHLHGNELSHQHVILMVLPIQIQGLPNKPNSRQNLSSYQIHLPPTNPWEVIS